MSRRIASALIALAVSLLPAIAAQAAPVVLFDQAHGERFLASSEEPLGLAGLARKVTDAGLEPRPLMVPCSDESLAGSAAIVISGPFAPFTPQEIEALARYVEKGGKVVVMLHIAPPARQLLQRLGVDASNGVIREGNNVLGNIPLNFTVSVTGTHEATKGLKTFNLYGAWALMPLGANAVSLAATSDKAWVDLDGDKRFGPKDVMQSFSVAVAGTMGKGAFLVFGDDAIFQNQFLKGENMQLAAALSTWLKP
jgi:hypothetical protein